MKSILILLILAIGTTQGLHFSKRGVSESKNGQFFPTDATGTAGNFHGIPIEKRGIPIKKTTREPRETEIVEANKVSQSFVIMSARSTT